MKELVDEIRRVEITEDRRIRYLLEMAKYNAALVILRDNDTRQRYWDERNELIELEDRYRAAAERDKDEAEKLRRQYDGKLKSFLASYVEEVMLSAGRDKECAEASHWDAHHERLASRILRQFKNRLYREILERLPYTEVTPPKINWDERRRTVQELVKTGARL